MSLRDVLKEVSKNLDNFEKLMNELKKKKEELEKETVELMKRAEKLRLLERVCFKIGKSCSIDACYVGVRVSRGVLARDNDSLILYEVSGCNVEIRKPETEDIYEALLRLNEITARAVEQLADLLNSL